MGGRDMIDVDYVGSETLPPEGYLQPRMYKITCRCLRCEQEYSWTAKSISKRDRPCPNPVCKEQARLEREAKDKRNFESILENGPPPVVGGSNQVKAIDYTAQTVMDSYGMTNLRDGIDPGESMAPKLPKPMQDAADNFFGGPKSNPAQQKRFADLGRRAIAGQFRGNSVNPNQALGRRPGESALTHVGSEPIQRRP
jgi:hypothetical protein